MSKTIEQISKELSRQIAGDVNCDVFSRAAFSTDASIYQIMPLCIVCPKNIEDVAAAIKYAGNNGIAIVARGAGSGLAGESLTSGIMLDMTVYMNRIGGFDEQSQTVTCQSGVVLNDLNVYLNDFGRGIGPDPSSGNRAVIGGIIANNATGAHSLKFGYIAEYVETIQVVLADGEIVVIENDVVPSEIENPKLRQIAQRLYGLLSENASVIENAQPKTQRNRSGYNIGGIIHGKRINLAKVMAGSEGTLGVFGEVKLKTVALTIHKGIVQMEFDSLGKMAEAVPIIVGCGATACELMDGRLVKMAADNFEHYRDLLRTTSAASLLVEVVGDCDDELSDELNSMIAAVGSLAEECIKVTDEDAQKRLWKCRKDAVPLLSRIKSKRKPVPFIEDASVENTKLCEYINGLRGIEKKYDIDMTYYGHAGDGELHIRPYLDLGSEDDLRKMKEIANDVFDLVWSLGGSISGEHADGLVRAAFIKKQYGSEFYEILKQVKSIFDADSVLNPGKIINEDPNVMTKHLRAERKILDDSKQTVLGFDGDEFEIELSQCTGCGLCRAGKDIGRMCPVFKAIGGEMGSSRARINLINAWAKGIISEKDFESKRFAEILSLCMNCKMCLKECPSGVDVSKLIIETRAHLAKRRVPISIAAKTMSMNRFMSIFASTFSPVSNFVMSLGITKWFIEKILGIDARRAMPKFGRSNFIKKANKYLAENGPVANPIDKVAYFVDTYANYNDHELGFAVLKFLRHNNIEVIVPKQRPAPLPGVVYGDVKVSRRDLEYNAKHLGQTIRSGYKIVCSEPSAALCLKEDMRLFVKSNDAKLVSENTFELINYLCELDSEGKLQKAQAETNENFAYHWPCHSQVLRTEDKVSKLINSLTGAKIKNLDSGCCGIAGTFGMQKKNYDMSMKVGEQLAEAIKSSNANIVLTECSTCKMQIEHMTDVNCVHPIKILAKAYGLLR